MQRVRRWCFTWNNYTEDTCTQMEYLKDNPGECNVRRLIVGKEVGEKGTPHLQGYIGFTKAMTLGMITKLLGKGGHWEAARGSDQDSEEYCGKEVPWINFGQNTTPGARNDLTSIKVAAKSGMGIRQMLDEGHVESLQQLQMAERVLRYYEPKRSWIPEVWVLWGDTGSGKTRRAYEIAGDHYYTKRAHTGKWWDGYDAHETVVLDEFRGSGMALTELLGVLDRYEFQVECKGGTRQLLAKKIIMTSIFHPKDWYPHAAGEPLGQLKRRITHIEHLKKHDEGL